MQGYFGHSVTLECSLPQSDPPIIAWKDAVWSKAHDKAPIYNSTESLEVVSDHPQSQFMSVDEKHRYTIRFFVMFVSVK